MIGSLLDRALESQQRARVEIRKSREAFGIHPAHQPAEVAEIPATVVARCARPVPRLRVRISAMSLREVSRSCAQDGSVKRRPLGKGEIPHDPMGRSCLQRVGGCENPASSSQRELMRNHSRGSWCCAIDLRLVLAVVLRLKGRRRAHQRSSGSGGREFCSRPRLRVPSSAKRGRMSSSRMRSSGA